MSHTTLIQGKEWLFESESRTDDYGFPVKYKVKLNANVNNVERNFNLSCNCPGWIYHKERWCWHCQEVYDTELDDGLRVCVISRKLERNQKLPIPEMYKDKPKMDIYIELQNITDNLLMEVGK